MIDRARSSVFVVAAVLAFTYSTDPNACLSSYPEAAYSAAGNADQRAVRAPQLRTLSWELTDC